MRQYEFDAVCDPEGAWQLASHAEDLTCHLYRLHGILSARSHFGVVACAQRRPWLATVVAVEGTELYSLSRDRLHVSRGGGQGIRSSRPKYANVKQMLSLKGVRNLCIHVMTGDTISFSSS